MSGLRWAFTVAAVLCVAVVALAFRLPARGPGAQAGAPDDEDPPLDHRPAEPPAAHRATSHLGEPDGQAPLNAPEPV